MSSACTTISTLVQERLGLLVTLTGKPDRLLDEPTGLVHLAAAALALVQQHAVDDKGRCRFCTRRRRWRRVRTRPCTVYAAVSADLTQPDELVHRQITELLHHRVTGTTAHTMPTPRRSDW